MGCFVRQSGIEGVKGLYPINPRVALSIKNHLHARLSRPIPDHGLVRGVEVMGIGTAFVQRDEAEEESVRCETAGRAPQKSGRVRQVFKNVAADEKVVGFCEQRMVFPLGDVNRLEIGFASGCRKAAGDLRNGDRIELDTEDRAGARQFKKERAGSETVVEDAFSFEADPGLPERPEGELHLCQPHVGEVVQQRVAPAVNLLKYGL